MGFLEWFSKNGKNQQPSMAKKNKPDRLEIAKKLVQESFRESKTKTVPPVQKTTPKSSVQTSTTINESIKMADHDTIMKNVSIECEEPERSLELYCPVIPAKIYCHSILIDKLGDLTKFIIISLYEGHSIEEIIELTQMGNTIIREESEYLFRGGLINDDGDSLTELGLEYGRLLVRFRELAEGIGVAFNTFANIFESINDEGYLPEAETKYILPNQFIAALVRNDNYSNSLDIAKEQLEEDIPFSREIKNSLYTTVKLVGSSTGYKKVCLRDFSRGSVTDNEPYINIAIPYDRIQCRPKYKWIDLYRPIVKDLLNIKDDYADLLTDKAKKIIKAVEEEDAAELIAMDVDLITGKMTPAKNLSNEEKKEDAFLTLDRRKIHLRIDSDVVNGMYLEETGRDEFYKIKRFSYKRMEAQ